MGGGPGMVWYCVYAWRKVGVRTCSGGVGNVAKIVGVAKENQAQVKAVSGGSVPGLQGGGGCAYVGAGR